MTAGNGKPGSLPGGHASRLSMARLLAGDLEAAEREALESHLHDCAACEGMRQEAVRIAGGFAEKYPTLEYLGATRRSRRNPVPERHSPWQRLWGTLAGAGGLRGALAGLILLVSAGALLRYGMRAPSEGDLAAKGGESGEGSAAFYLFVNGKQARGDTVRCGPGDTLQFGIISPKPVHYALLYRDDEGPMDAYMGGEAGVMAPAGNPKGENLPNSLVLEGKWKVEMIYCVWSAEPLSLDKAKARAEAAPGTDVKDPKLKTYVLINPR